MKSMHVRDFMRGGYKEIKEATVVTKHGRPIGIWIPPWQDFMLMESKGGTGKTSIR